MNITRRIKAKIASVRTQRAIATLKKAGYTFRPADLLAISPTAPARSESAIEYFDLKQFVVDVPVEKGIGISFTDIERNAAIKLGDSLIKECDHKVLPHQPTRNGGIYPVVVHRFSMWIGVRRR